MKQWLDWSLPQHCLLCNDPTAGPALCCHCQNDLPYLTQRCDRCALPLPEAGRCGYCQAHPPGFQSCICPLLYQQPVVSLVTALKFRRRLEAAAVLANLMAQSAHSTLANNQGPELLIPVPLHPQRLQQRGYNQALLLAQPLSRTLNIPLDNRLCRRVLHHPPQLGLNRKQRQHNLRHAFEVVDRPSADHVAIIDDVLTTGSTADALATALQRAGVKRVDIWVAARVAKATTKPQ